MMKPKKEAFDNIGPFHAHGIHLFGNNYRTQLGGDGRTGPAGNHQGGQERTKGSARDMRQDSLPSSFNVIVLKKHHPDIVYQR